MLWAESNSLGLTNSRSSLTIMDELLAHHRKEQRDLQSQVTQKKKSASKKARKGVNDECEKLEQDLKARQQHEIATLNDGSAGTGEEDEKQDKDDEGSNSDDDILAAILNTSSKGPSSAPDLKDLSISDNDGADGNSAAQEPRKGNRQKARLARRAAEQEELVAQAAKEAANLPDLKERERMRMVEEFEKRGLQEKEVAANGHCLYSAVADQMRQAGLHIESGQDMAGELKEVQRDDYKTVRQAAAQYMLNNGDDFAPFLEEPLDEYVHKVKDTGEWGGQLELLALAKTYHININVLQGDGRVEKIEGSPDTNAKDVWLAYYRHGFGLGEHYNSLRKKNSEASKV